MTLDASLTQNIVSLLIQKTSGKIQLVSFEKRLDMIMGIVVYYRLQVQAENNQHKDAEDHVQILEAACGDSIVIHRIFIMDDNKIFNRCWLVVVEGRNSNIFFNLFKIIEEIKHAYMHKQVVFFEYNVHFKISCGLDENSIF